MKTDIHNIGKELQNAKSAFNMFKMNEINRALCKEYLQDCQIGWSGCKPVDKARAIKLYTVMKTLTRFLELSDPELTWHYVDTNLVKDILGKIDNSEWGEWYNRDHKIIMRKFLLWLRVTKGYPKDYPNAEQLNSPVNLRLMKYPMEANYSTKRPNKLKSPSEIPTADEAGWLIQVWEDEVKEYRMRGYTSKLRIAIRNRAIISLIIDTGARIGGLGSLSIGDVVFDEMGARIAITDKTMRGDLVRLIFSYPSLKEWIDIHPGKNNPEAPLWIDLDTGAALSYFVFQWILSKTREIHNSYANAKGLPLITKHLHFHAFRYYAQGRDALAGMPIAVMCKQRGWSPTSDMPQHYSRISSSAADEWITEHYGIKKPEIAENDYDFEEREPKQPKKKKQIARPSAIIPGYC